ncbi:MAG TPA: hypothetical protein VI056_06435 [Candidatus Limnocylindria bacterium]
MRIKRLALILGGAVLVAALSLGNTPRSAASVTFLETFDGAPNMPTPWHPANWDVTVHSRDVDTFTSLELMHAGHGVDCSAPPATHDISSYGDAVFLCRDHVMTAIKASGYGVVYLTPNQLVDFSGGEAVVRFDVSTLRTSDRDWIDLWITPFDQNVQLVGDIGDVDLNGYSRNAVHIRQDQINRMAIFRGGVVRNFNEFLVGANDALALERVLVPSATVRTTFELRVSRTHLKFGIPALGAWWVDSDMADLAWTSGVLQIGHHSYNPEKSDGCGPPVEVSSCSANTWHWDNISISPATPFTILNASRATASASSSSAMTFAAPAPSNSHLRFAGIGRNIAVSFDGGQTWQAAQRQAYGQQLGEEHFDSYWTPIPAGTKSVLFRGTDWYGGPWLVRSAGIWASAAPTTVPPLPTAPPGGGNPTPPPPGGGNPPPPAPTPGPVAVVPTPPGTLPGTLALTPGFHSGWVEQSAYPQLAPGELGAVTVRFRNLGTESWQVGVPGRQVNIGVVGDSTEFADRGLAEAWLSPNRPATTSESLVPPGGIGTFTFKVRATRPPGEYRIDLALVADGVAWLEDQGVYIVVNSDAGLHSAWVAQTPWPVLRAGELSAPITVVFRNTGNASWIKGSAREMHLGVVGDDRSWADLGIDWPAPDRVAVQTESAVRTGDFGSFTFRMQAPDRPGVYALRLRPVVDGVTWLEDQGVFVQITVSP